jgi:S-adenosylmethionine-diacylglycerol 3-amino-3-carboxypropyl transferase
MEFYKHLNYSLGNEDWNAEEQALKVKPGDTALCVTASGDRALHLLMTECAQIISVDMNHIQNYLLELKLAAINHLDFDKYLAFLGCTPCSHRKSTFMQLKSSLSPEAARYWMKNEKMITSGIIYQGIVERFTRYSGFFLNLLRRSKIQKLLSFSDQEEQKEFIRKYWDTPFWRKLFETLCNPKFSRLILNDPGLNMYTEYANPGTYINQRMTRYLQHNLARKSPLLQLILTGKVMPDAYFPYLTEEGYHLIRRDTSRITLRTENIVEFLNNQSDHRIDCFSLSDIASYMPQNTFEKLLQGIQQSANHGARFCMREFVSKRYIPAELKSVFQRETDLEQKLELEETNFVYRFMVGEIKK